MAFTPKQQKLIKIIIDNYGNKGKTKTLGEMLLEAGYSESSATNPQLIINEEMQELINPIIDKMEKVRTKALDKITDEKLDAGTARDNAYVADILTKNIQLLSGGNTQNIKVDSDLTVEQREGLLGLLK